MSRGLADSGIEKWPFDTNKITMTYYDKGGNVMLFEEIKQDAAKPPGLTPLLANPPAFPDPAKNICLRERLEPFLPRRPAAGNSR